MTNNGELKGAAHENKSIHWINKEKQSPNVKVCCKHFEDTFRLIVYHLNKLHNLITKSSVLPQEATEHNLLEISKTSCWGRDTER